MPRAKWLTGLTVSALLITSMAPSALAETGYITSKTKIYQQPRTNSVSIVVPKGTEVIIVEYGKGSYDGWVRIENPSNGVTAYVKERYVAEDEDSKDEPPAQEEEEQEPEEEVSKETFPRLRGCGLPAGVQVRFHLFEQSDDHRFWPGSDRGGNARRLGQNSIWLL